MYQEVFTVVETARLEVVLDVAGAVDYPVHGQHR